MSHWKYVFSLFAVLMAALPVQADEVQQQIFADNLKRAEAGDANAQFIVGHRYEIGVGTEKNMEKAFEWYSKAAQKGHPLAQLKTEARNEEADKESRARHDSEAARRAEQQSRAEAEARNKAQAGRGGAQQSPAGPSRPRRRASARPPRRPSSAVAEAKPVAVSSGKPETAAKTAEAASENPVNAMDVVLEQPVAGQQDLGRNPAVAEHQLPAHRHRGGDLLHRRIAADRGRQQTVLYREIGAEPFRQGRIVSGPLRVQRHRRRQGRRQSGGGGRSLSEIKPNLGWQEPGYTANCRAGSDRSIQCVTDRKAVVQFVKM